MRLSGKSIVLLLVGAICLAADKPSGVKWSDIPDGVVIGELGIPLGTYCRIQGTAMKPDELSKADQDGAIDLIVDTVDDKKLDQPVGFRSPDGLEKLKQQPSPGQAFIYVAYETGRFVGPISDPNNLAPQLKERSGQNNFGSYYNLRLELHVVDPRMNAK